MCFRLKFDELQSVFV